MSLPKVPRDEHGYWMKGYSANPGGRQRMDPALKKTIRDMSPKLFRRLRRLAMKADSDHVSVSAIKLLLAYAWGQPGHQDEPDRPAGANPLDELTVEELRSLARQSLAAERDDDAGDNDDESPH